MQNHSKRGQSDGSMIENCTGSFHPLQHEQSESHGRNRLWLGGTVNQVAELETSMWDFNAVRSDRAQVKAMRARLRRANVKLGEVESYVERVYLEKIIQNLEDTIVNLKDRIAYNSKSS